MKETLAGRVREAARELGAGDKTFTVDDLADRMGTKTYKEKDPIRNTLRDFRRRGEVVRVAPGVYNYRGKQGGKPEIQEVMWRTLRSMRTVTIEDLQMMAGAEEDYAREWLGFLIRRGNVRKSDNGTYRLIKDPVEMPRNDEKAEKLRRLRAKLKAAKEAVDEAFNELSEVEE